MNAVIKHGFAGAPFEEQGGLILGRMETGFDTLSIQYIGVTTQPTIYADANFPIASPVIGYPNMYIADVQMQREGFDIYRFTVSAKGLLGIQAVKRTINTKTQTYTTGPITLPSIGAVGQAQGIYVNLSCQFHYVSLFAPLLNVEPQNAVPPAGASLPSPPSNPFASPPTTPIYNYPNGWLREGIELDTVNGAEVYLIREDWVYKYPYMPG
jgi:hypothetical protein